MNLEKLKFCIKPSTVFSVFKILHFVMRLFGLYPFKIEHTKNGPNLVICTWGVILTILHFSTYCFCYFKAINSKIPNSKINTTLYTSIVDKFGVNLLLILDGIIVFVFFLNIVITIKYKVQKNMFSLFYESEKRLKDKEFQKHLCFDIEILKIIFFLIFICLNLIGTVFVALQYFLAMNKSNPDEVFFFVAKLLPQYYTILKSSQYILYILMIHFSFNRLNNGIS